MDAIVKTDFCFPGQKSVYKGKVRDVYDINDEYLVMVVSDRISAFDVILPFLLFQQIRRGSAKYFPRTGPRGDRKRHV